MGGIEEILPPEIWYSWQIFVSLQSCLGYNIELFFTEEMKLAEYKKVVQDIPAIYDEYDVKTCPCDGNYDIDDFTIDDDNKQIVMEPWQEMSTYKQFLT